MLGYATTSELARRWSVDRQTARTAIENSGIVQSDLHLSRRYAWIDILRKIECWPLAAIEDVDITDVLSCAGELADMLCVSSPTIRNYGKSGRLHEVRLASRTLRYAFPATLLEK